MARDIDGRIRTYVALWENSGRERALKAAVLLFHLRTDVEVHVEVAARVRGAVRALHERAEGGVPKGRARRLSRRAALELLGDLLVPSPRHVARARGSDLAADAVALLGTMADGRSAYGLLSDRAVVERLTSSLVDMGYDGAEIDDVIIERSESLARRSRRLHGGR